MNQILDDLYTAKELAAKFKMKEQTLYSYLHYSQLPEKYNLVVSIGRCKRFVGKNVEKWLLDGAPLKKRNK